jgi:hypothetical protein
LIRHRKIHTEVKRFKCDKCSKDFSTSSNLKIHQISHNRKDESIFNCFISGCEKKYYYICTLKKHLSKSHRKEFGELENNLTNDNFSSIYKEFSSRPKIASSLMEMKTRETDSDLPCITTVHESNESIEENSYDVKMNQSQLRSINNYCRFFKEIERAYSKCNMLLENQSENYFYIFNMMQAFTCQIAINRRLL